MRNASLFAVAGVAVFWGAGRAVAANFIQNGDFSANGAAYTNFPGYNGPSNGNPASPTNWFSLSGAPWGTNNGVNKVLNGYNFNPSPFAPGDGGGPSLPTGTSYFGFMQSSTGGTTYFGTLGQNFTTALAPSTTYTLSFDAASRNGNTSDLNIVINDGSATAPDTYGGNNVYDTRVGSTAQGSSTSISPSASGFQHYTITFTTSADAGTTGDGSLIFLNLSNGGDSTADITNVSLPEPASLGLLGLGALGLLARRRLV